MTTSLSSSCKLIAALSVVCLLVCMPSESEARSCVFGCMTSLFKCKRMAALEDKENAGAVCCELYEECFLDCKPNADKLPPCDRGKGKRANWAKRFFSKDEQDLKSFDDLYLSGSKQG